MSKKKILIIIILSVIIAILALLFSVIFSIINMNNETIFSGISINGINMSGKTKEEATSLLNDFISKKMEKDIELNYENSELKDSDNSETEYHNSISFSALDIQYDINNAVSEAYNYGKTENIFKNNFAILGVLIHTKNIDIDISLDEDSLNIIIDDASKNLPGKMIENSYYIEDDNLIITRGTVGSIVDADEFRNMLETIINDISSSEHNINVPVKTSTPSEIDVQSIHEEIYKEPKDAYYEKEPFKVYTEVKGVNFDIETANTQISQSPEEKEYKIPLIYTKPKVSISDLDINIFPDLLATFPTRYDATNKNRSTNLKLAAGKINGKILAPGEEFSYNKVVGERTIAAGYKEAAIYSSGQVVDGLGGGICQISSTLYNAVVFANLDVTERHNHQFVTSYVDAGRDATVVYGVKDFKFVNNRTYPIKILLTVEYGIAKAEIYGIKEDVEYDVSFDVQTISNIPYTIQYQDDPSLELGKEKIIQYGHSGKTVNTYKVLKKSGTIISKELLSKDKYNSLVRIIKRGTKASSAPVNTTPTQPIDPTPVEPTPPVNDSQDSPVNTSPNENIPSVQPPDDGNSSNENNLNNTDL